MTTENGNPTASSDGGATTADPIDRIEAWLDKTGGDSTNQDKTAAVDPDEKPAKTPDKPENGARDDDKEPQFTTAHLAQYLGVEESAIDVDDEGQPVFKTKIDGKEGSAKLAEVIKSYQLQGHAENRVREVAQREAALQTRMQQADQQIQARLQQFDTSLQQVATLTQVAQEEMAREYKAIPWDSLRRDNPGEYAALQTEFQSRNARLQGVFGELNQRRTQAMQVAQQQQAELQGKTLQAEAERMKTVIPEWNDRATASKEQSELTDWALSRGYDPSYLNALHNAQVPNSAIVIRDLRNAWKHDTMQKTKPDIENRVRTAPKLVKPGQAPSTDANAADLKSLKQQVRQTGANSQKALEAYLLKSGKA